MDDSDADLLGSRGRGKGFSSLATADCPVSVASRQTNGILFYTFMELGWLMLFAKEGNAFAEFTQ